MTPPGRCPPTRRCSSSAKEGASTGTNAGRKAGFLVAQERSDAVRFQACFAFKPLAILKPRMIPTTMAATASHPCGEPLGK